MLAQSHDTDDQMFASNDPILVSLGEGIIVP